MTLEKWLKIIQMNEVPPDVWYEYYVEKGGNFGFDYFWKNFQIAITRELTTLNKIPPRKMNFDTALTRLYNFYNNKYGI